jgi:secondary thiamine-phosphate synthase enzyme
MCEDGNVETTEIRVETGDRATTVDLTAQVKAFCDGKGDGLVSVFVPHATAGVAIFETGAGSDSDVLDAIDRLLPADPSLWRHEHGTPGHGRDHVLPAFVSPSVTIPVIGGRPTLGTWQAVVLVDTNVDNRSRSVRLSFLNG